MCGTRPSLTTMRWNDPAPTGTSPLYNLNSSPGHAGGKFRTNACSEILLLQLLECLGAYLDASHVEVHQEFLRAARGVGLLHRLQRIHIEQAL